MAATAPAPGSVDLAAARVADLHALYGESVYRYCRKRLRSHEDAEDATQIVFMNAHRALAQGVEPRSESAWLFKIAENVVLYRHRTSVRRARNEFPADTSDLREIRQPVPDMRGVAREIAEALSKVPPSQQRAFVLREWQGLPYQTIAAELNVSVEAATALVVRARNNISRELERPSRLRRVGSLAAWLLTPVERVISSGVILKTAAGVATVVIGLPAAETVLERHAAEAGVPVSVTNAKAKARTTRPGSTARYGGAAVVVHGGGSVSQTVKGVRPAVRPVADLGAAVDGATPGLAATPDAGAAPAEAPAAGDTSQAPADPQTAPSEPAQAAAGDSQSQTASGGDAQGQPGQQGQGQQGQHGQDPAPGNPGHPVSRPTLPPKSKGKPPADPGSQAITRSGDDGSAS